ncbi:MAG: mannose-1-phosphate guanylyltransferase [Candidatus Omnitrophica bacterium]|nr:mannose-1-phosphate guanylyltransferase [Candidatus Omnitrophota bacterium]
MLWALVMAGGLGTRLWPLSRKKFPKPFLKLIPGRASLLEETIKRLSPLISSKRIFVIGNEEHLSGMRKCAPRIPKSQVIGEPASRNTAATVGLAASLILKKDPQALILVLPADHWIEDHKKFHQTIRTAERISKRTKLFSIFGVKPTFASASYGYLRAGRKITVPGTLRDRFATKSIEPVPAVPGTAAVYELKQFVEKPSAARARKFMRAGNYFWHAGIFLAPAQTILSSLIEYSPRLAWRIAKLSVRKGRIFPKAQFRSLPNISIDYAVLEKLPKAHLIQTGFKWCDVGTWKSFEDLWAQDRFGNAVLGSCLTLNSEDNIVYSQGKFICLQGVKDLVIVDTPDALLISRKDSGEKMRKVVVHLAQKKLAKFS